MPDIFRLAGMIGNAEERRVATYKKNGLFVDTCLVTDSDKPYETAVAHPAYNKGKMIIVELYDTKEEAKKGHDKWLKRMTTGKLPETLRDTSTAVAAGFCDIGGKNWRINLPLKG